MLWGGAHRVDLPARECLRERFVAHTETRVVEMRSVGAGVVEVSVVDDAADAEESLGEG